MALSLNEYSDKFGLDQPKLKRLSQKAPIGTNEHLICVECVATDCKHMTGSRPTFLSRREIRALLLLTKGLHDKEIGVALGLTPGSAKQLVFIIASKLKVTGRVQMAIWAERNIVLLKGAVERR